MKRITIKGEGGMNVREKKGEGKRRRERWKREKEKKKKRAKEKERRFEVRESIYSSIPSMCLSI